MRNVLLADVNPAKRSGSPLRGHCQWSPRTPFLANGRHLSGKAHLPGPGENVATFSDRLGRSWNPKPSSR